MTNKKDQQKELTEALYKHVPKNDEAPLRTHYMERGDCLRLLCGQKPASFKCIPVADRKVANEKVLEKLREHFSVSELARAEHYVKPLFSLLNYTDQITKFDRKRSNKGYGCAEVDSETTLYEWVNPWPDYYVKESEKPDRADVKCEPVTDTKDDYLESKESGDPLYYVPEIPFCWTILDDQVDNAQRYGELSNKELHYLGLVVDNPFLESSRGSIITWLESLYSQLFSDRCWRSYVD